MTEENLGIAEEVIRRLREEDGFPERCKLFLAGKYQPMEGVEVTPQPFSKLEKRLSKHFGHSITVDPYPKEFTPEFLANAAKFNMKPVFLPGEDITQDRQLRRWIKPEKWFYDQIRAGKIQSYGSLLPTVLCRGWYLADFSVGVDCTDGTQVFPNDPWAPLITELREKKLVGGYKETPAGSRFAITWDEWNNCVLSQMAAKLGVPRANIRLERAIEFNAIGNLYDRNRGHFNMWEWFTDVFEDSYRLYGGRRGSGGLAHVSCSWSGSRDDDIAGRPLVSF